MEMLFGASFLVALVGGGDQPAFSSHMFRLVNTKVRSGAALAVSVNALMCVQGP